MMDLKTVIKMIQRQWKNELSKTPFVLPPEAKYVTGNAKNDFYIHYLETVCGIEIELTPDLSKIARYKIVNDKKFLWFTLRWS